MRHFTVALLALVPALEPGTKCTGQIESARVEGHAQLTYDASFEKPVRPTYRQLPPQVPAGYEWEWGRRDDAKDILREAWDHSPQLQAILAKGERKEKVGASQHLVRTLALVDPRRALKLIELTSLPEEIKRLKTEALVLAAEPSRPRRRATTRTSPASWWSPVSKNSHGCTTKRAATGPIGAAHP
ncbi:MAG: hypothetical protein FJ276_17570 [Planctomycetes bacterium]|nr:hypothetical protein [Planctomycetota bacterium]